MVWKGKKMQWKYLFAAVAAVALTLACAREKDTSKTVSKEEREIKAAQSAYVEAFNKKNVDLLASLWAEDASYFNITTKESAEGRDQIVKFIGEGFKQNASLQLQIQTDTVDVKQPDYVAVKGFLITACKDKPPVKSGFIADYVKINGSWLLEKVRELEIVPPPSRYEKLKELEWLVGDWEDGDENVDVNFSCHWDTNKNFLQQNFDLKILELKNLEGHQFITWDPAKDTICSWIFDSDGGFGNSIWTQDDGSWYVSTTFSLPDGRKGSSTNIYKKIDDNTYTFASCSRDIDGKVMPNIGPFTVVRKEGVRP
jgi:uncharacterized protein (TIGR02246 family)